jgi:hypothetical protein
MIFARQISDGLTSLVKKVDAETAKNAKAKMGSFVVFCDDDEKLEDKLKALAKKQELKKTVLSVVDSKSGPEGVELNKDADVTVCLYVKKKVVSQFAYKKGELKDKDIQAILKDLPKILPKNDE